MPVLAGNKMGPHHIVVHGPSSDSITISLKINTEHKFFLMSFILRSQNAMCLHYVYTYTVVKSKCLGGKTAYSMSKTA